MNHLISIISLYQEITPKDAFGLSTSFILLTAILFKIKSWLLSKNTSLWIGLLWAALLFLPLPNLKLPILFYFRGFWGDLSVATLLLSCLFLLRQTKLPSYSSFSYSRREYSYFYRILMFIGVFFYPFALGVTYFDPYPLGYTSEAFELILIGFAALALYRQCFLFAHWLLLSLLAHHLEIYETTNLFDILFDPLICIFSLVISLNRFIKKLFQSKKFFSS